MSQEGEKKIRKPTSFKTAIIVVVLVVVPLTLAALYFGGSLVLDSLVFLAKGNSLDQEAPMGNPMMNLVGGSGILLAGTVWLILTFYSLRKLRKESSASVQ